MTQLSRGFYRVNQTAHLRWRRTSRGDYPSDETLDKGSVVYATERNDIGESHFDGNTSGTAEGEWKLGGWRTDHSWVVVVSLIDENGDAPQGWVDNAKLDRLRNEVEQAFQKGDVLYGRSEAREPWVERLNRNSDFGSQIVRHKYNIIDNMNNAILRRDLSDGVVQRFADFLEETGQKASDTRIRKMCKSGLTYVTTVMRNKVHFLLDGLDAKRVVLEAGVGTRLGSQEEWSAPTKYCTGAEMRRLMRQRMFDIDSDAGSDYKIDLNNVYFYLATERVPAPWERNAPANWSAAWNEYKRYRKAGRGH